MSNKPKFNNIIAKLAREISRYFDRKSPINFASLPDERKQIFYGLVNKKPESTYLNGLSKQDRFKLIDELRALGHEVSDTGYGDSLSPGMQAIYKNDPVVARKWFDIPYRPNKVFVEMQARRRKS